MQPRVRVHVRVRVRVLGIGFGLHVECGLQGIYQRMNKVETSQGQVRARVATGIRVRKWRTLQLRK